MQEENAFHSKIHMMYFVSITILLIPCTW